jgi:hypothetical protein
VTLSSSPRLVKGGIVLIDPGSGAVRRVIALQYNPRTLTRSLQINPIAADGDRLQPLRLKGPPVETITLEAELDATDQLEFPDQHPDAVEVGLHPQLAALESMVYPTSQQLLDNNALADSGALEIAPMEAPLTLFVWSRNRVLPVRVTSLSIAEEAFDAALNPIRAKVSLGLRVLTVDDVQFTHKAGGLFMSHLQQKEGLSNRGTAAVLGALGIGEIP